MSVLATIPVQCSVGAARQFVVALCCVIDCVLHGLLDVIKLFQQCWLNCCSKVVLHNMLDSCCTDKLHSELPAGQARFCVGSRMQACIVSAMRRMRVDRPVCHSCACIDVKWVGDVWPGRQKSIDYCRKWYLYCVPTL